MKILHTSDWHLGASINKRERSEDFRFVIDQVLKIIRDQGVQALILAGDIYDTYSPPNWAQEMFYQFLCDAREAGVREVIVTSGNHDNSREVTAPGPLVSRLKFHLVGQNSTGEKIDQAIIPLGSAERPEAVVCAVPFIRIRDISDQSEEQEEGESNQSREEQMRRGLQKHYERLCARARELYPNVPIIATGHFTAVGGKISGDQEIGGLESVSLADFPAEIDYFALGHFHRPQKVRSSKNAYYSGSLVQIDFGEGGEEIGSENSSADSGKSVYIIDTENIAAEPVRVPIPQKRKFVTLRGTVSEIEKQFDQIARSGEPCYLRAINTGEYCGSFIDRIRQRAEEIKDKDQVKDHVAGDRMIVVTAENEKCNPVIGHQYRNLDENGKPLQIEKLEPRTVFLRLLAEKNEASPGQYNEEKQAKLLEMFDEIYRLYEENGGEIGDEIENRG